MIKKHVELNITSNRMIARPRKEIPVIIVGDRIKLRTNSFVGQMQVCNHFIESGEKTQMTNVNDESNEIGNTTPRNICHVNDAYSLCCGRRETAWPRIRSAP
jgi:hypothetical protein